MMKKRSAFGWSELIIGIVLLLLGIFTFMRPYKALTGIVFVYGILAVITGIADILFYVKVEQRTGFGPAVSLVTGILSLLAGILLLFNPGTGSWAMAVLFPLWFIAHCISTADSSARHPADCGNRLLLFFTDREYPGTGTGFFMIFDPVLSLFSVEYIIGCYLLLTGIDHLVLGISNLRM